MLQWSRTKGGHHVSSHSLSHQKTSLFLSVTPCIPRRAGVLRRHASQLHGTHRRTDAGGRRGACHPQNGRHHARLRGGQRPCDDRRDLPLRFHLNGPRAPAERGGVRARSFPFRPHGGFVLGGLAFDAHHQRRPAGRLLDGAHPALRRGRAPHGRDGDRAHCPIERRTHLRHSGRRRHSALRHCRHPRRHAAPLQARPEAHRPPQRHPARYAHGHPRRARLQCGGV